MPSKFKYINFREFLSHIITGGTNQLTEVLTEIKINLEKAVKLNSLDTFWKKYSFSKSKKIHGLHDDLKLYENN